MASEPPLILVVDDNPRNLQVAGNLLQESGYDLVFATDGIEAIECAREESPDLILLDVMMPDMDGFEVCRTIKADRTTATIPVIFLTAKVEDEDIVSGFAVGGVDYVTKPFRSQELLARVQTHVDLVKMRNALEDSNRILSRQARSIKQANNQLEEGNRQLKRLNELKSEFLGIAVHDLKNPLSVIAGISQLVLDSELERQKQEGAEDEENIELLSTVVKSSSHMKAIIEDLLSSESLEGSDIELHLDVHDLADLVRSVVSLNRKRAEVKGITIIQSLADNCFANVDGQRMVEAMDNLVSNAIKYSPSQKSVHISLDSADGLEECVRFGVRDEGPGLTPDDKSKLFSKFQKLSARPTGGEHSTGLGLFIVKRLIDLHNGTIAVSSEPGQGASFSIELAKA